MQKTKTDLEIMFAEEVDADDPHQLMDFGEEALFKGDEYMWKVCFASAQIVGKFSGKTKEFAGRLGKVDSTVQFYAKAWRVRKYVHGYSVPCSLGFEGIADSELICRNLTFTHYGVVHSRAIQSIRVDGAMEYYPVVEPEEVLSWLAECVEPLKDEARRLSPQALLHLLEDAPDQTQWFEKWGGLKESLMSFLFLFSETLPPGLRDRLAELIQEEWE